MAERPDQHSYIRDVLRRTGLNQTELAKRAGLDPSTLSRFLSSPTSPTLRATTIRRIEQASGVIFGTGGAATDDSTPGLSESEALPLAAGASDLVTLMLTHLRSANGSVDAWTLRSRALELGGFRPGDILFVKLGAPALKGDVVCAQVYDWTAARTETVFRIFDPPYLISATADPRLFAPFRLDDERIAVKGVVLHSLRNK